MNFVSIFRVSVIFISVFYAVTMIGCNDGNSVFFDYIIEFIPDLPATEDNTVSLSRFDSTPDVLGLAVYTYNITRGSVHSVYFDIVFRDYILEFDKYDVGDFLEEAGDVNYQVGIDSQDPSRLVVGITLFGDAAVAPEGSGALIYLYFKPKRLGTCPMWFENSWMKDNNGPAGNFLTGIAWFGGHAYVGK